MSIITGVGPDVPVVVNKRGGRQSMTLYRFDLLDPRAMFALTEVLATGAEKYGESNWRQIDASDHVNHALQHLFAWLASDTADAHLAHAFCRCMMALAVELEGCETT